MSSSVGKTRPLTALNEPRRSPSDRALAAMHLPCNTATPNSSKSRYCTLLSFLFRVENWSTAQYGLYFCADVPIALWSRVGCIDRGPILRPGANDLPGHHRRHGMGISSVRNFDVTSTRGHDVSANISSSKGVITQKGPYSISPYNSELLQSQIVIVRIHLDP